MEFLYGSILSRKRGQSHNFMFFLEAVLLLGSFWISFISIFFTRLSGWRCSLKVPFRGSFKIVKAFFSFAHPSRPFALKRFYHPVARPRGHGGLRGWSIEERCSFLYRFVFIIWILKEGGQNIDFRTFSAISMHCWQISLSGLKSGKTPSAGYFEGM